MQSAQPASGSDSSQLTAIVANFLPDARVRPLFFAISGGYSSARVWKADVGGATFALRRWPADSLPPERVRGLHQLLRHIANSGVSCVAVPLANPTGQSLVKVDSHYWQLEPWLPGTADFHESPSDVRLQNASRTLADWHLAAARFECPDGLDWFHSRAGRSPAVLERTRRIESWMNESTLRNVWNGISAEADSKFRDVAARIMKNAKLSLRVVNEELRGMHSVRFQLQPCLRDVWHDHVLFADDTVTGLIDANACRTENVATDLARLLGSLVEDDRPRWTFALDAYADVRPLSADELRLVRVLDRSAVVLSPLTWLHRRYIQRLEFPDHSAVVERLKAQSKRLNTLTQSLASS